MKRLLILAPLAAGFAFSPGPASAWWQFVANGPHSERQVSPHFRTERECKAALKATQVYMAKKFPDRYPLVGSCEAYR